MLRWFILLPLSLAACSQQEPAPSKDGSETPTAAPMRDEGHRYTRLDGCNLLRSAPEEGGFYEQECEGEGGYRLRLVEADLRENITVISPDGGEQSLGLPALASGAFSSLGDTAEWRGAMEGGRFTPHALILRQSVVEDPEPGVPEASYLLAIRLDGEACVVARVPPGAEQNQRARAAADAGGECLSAPGG